MHLPVVLLRATASAHDLVIISGAPFTIAVVKQLAGSAWLVTFAEGQNHALFEVDTAGMGGTSPFALVEEVSSDLYNPCLPVVRTLRLSGGTKRRACMPSLFEIMGELRKTQARV